MATLRERRAYARKLQQITRNFNRLERATLQQSIKLLKDVRNQVAGQLTGTDFSQFRVAEQQKAIDAIIAEYEEQARDMASDASLQAYKLGGQSVIDPLKAANVKVSFFRPSKAQVDVLTQFSADLIGGKIAPELRHSINRSIQLNALGGNSSIDAMKDITQALFKSNRPPTAREPVKGIAYEAERILRTETNRAYSIATNAQQEKLAEDVPGLQKQWLATGDNRTRLSHLNAHGDIVDVGEPFVVGGAKLMFPLDPAGPPQETINCRCRSITVIPEIGPLESPLDAEIEAEKARRAKDEKAKVEKVKPVEHKEFRSVREIEKWGKSEYGDWQRTLGSDEDKMKGYMAGEYKWINKELRTGVGIDADSLEWQETIDRQLARNPLKTDIVSYRGMSLEAFGDDPSNMIGAIIEDNGYTSTSLSRTEADRFAFFVRDRETKQTPLIAKINIPKGTNGAYLEGVLDMKEQEFLLSRGSQFRITSVVPDTATAYGKTIDVLRVNMELIP